VLELEPEPERQITHPLCAERVQAEIFNGHAE
jgi:hypothetical protein